MSFISTVLIDHVSGGLSQSTIDEISAFQNNIRSLLHGYETFLQGSYANDTAISEINDVDIVALENPNGYLPTIGATSIFNDIKSKLEANLNYRGMVTIGNKCLKLSLETRDADIVPAVHPLFGQPNRFGEPILIANNIANYPKTHKNNGQIKNQNTNNNYKRIVRMIKNYINNWNLKNIAPSFYVECMIYSYDNGWFGNDLPATLNHILTHMISTNFNSNFNSVAGDKRVITLFEWTPQNFTSFRQHVINKLQYLNSAISATNELVANGYFRNFFNL